ncbi:hypothetical protein D9613_006132 [Agrocybe pediades]|uniref:F-box domain-containing protein n=1 Tax=Agrocybe pediades TaxID=84607 RepID=A0A8H4VPL2_9AGAR|nr:hypothetical protein D9613_006132 [Agrocybe pediades]
MSRKHFQAGLSCFQAGKYEEALTHLNKATENGTQAHYLIYDTRAAVYSKLGQTKEAIKDAKKTIEVAPDRWQGYARAARLFLQIKKTDASLTMVSMALERLKEAEAERRASLLTLKEEIEKSQEKREMLRRRFTDHTVKLPIELFAEIARMLSQEDHTTVIPLSQVSKTWRDVILGLPYLWDVLLLTRRRPRQKTKLWLERSKGKIRELSIRESTLTTPHWSGDGLEILKWEHLRVLKVQKWDVGSFLLSIGKLHSLKNLEHIEINSVPSSYSFPFGKQSVFHEEHEIQLKNLTMVSTTLTGDNFPRRMTTLTNLTLQYFNTTGALGTLLQANSALGKLSLTNIMCEDINSDATFDLPCLTHLELKGHYPRFIYSLNMPNLITLKIENPPTYLNPTQLMRTLIQNGSSQLSELGLRSCHFDATILISLLRKTKALTALEVTNTAGEALAILDVLADSTILDSKYPDLDDPTPYDGVLCPHLTHVNLSRCPDVQTGPLVRLIKSRLPPQTDPAQASEVVSEPAQILKLVVDECPKIDSTWLPWLREKVPSVSCVFMKRNTKFRA